MVFSSVFSGGGNMLRFMQSSKNHDLTQLLYPQDITVITCCFYRGGSTCSGLLAGGRRRCSLRYWAGSYIQSLLLALACAPIFSPNGGYPGNLVFFYQAPFYKIT
jgi:hypothetical protein